MPDNVVAWDSDKSNGVFVPVARTLVAGAFASVIDTNVADIADIVPGSAKAQGATNLAADAGSRAGGVPLAFPNLFVNGGHEQWQRGTGAFTGSGSYAADSWQLAITGTDTLSVSRDSANADIGSKYCSACTFGLGSGAGLTEYRQLFNAATDFTQLMGQRVTITFRVKCAVAGAVRASLMVDGVVLSNSAFHTGSGLYETLTVTGLIAASGVTYVSARVLFAAACTAYVDDVMGVIGSVPSVYVPMHPADDIARDQRYYELLAEAQSGSLVLGDAGAPATAGGQFGRVCLVYKVKKAVSPTVTVVGGWSNVNCGTPFVGNFDTLAVRLATSVVGAGAFSTVNNGSASTITVEANP